MDLFDCQTLVKQIAVLSHIVCVCVCVCLCVVSHLQLLDALPTCLNIVLLPTAQ